MKEKDSCEQGFILIKTELDSHLCDINVSFCCMMPVISLLKERMSVFFFSDVLLSLIRAINTRVLQNMLIAFLDPVMMVK